MIFSLQRSEPGCDKSGRPIVQDMGKRPGQKTLSWIPDAFCEISTTGHI